MHSFLEASLELREVLLLITEFSQTLTSWGEGSVCSMGCVTNMFKAQCKFVRFEWLTQPKRSLVGSWFTILAIMTFSDWN